MISSVDVSELQSKSSDSLLQLQKFKKVADKEMRDAKIYPKSVVLMIVSQLNTLTVDRSPDFQRVLNQMYDDKSVKYMQIKGDNREIYTTWLEFFSVYTIL